MSGGAWESRQLTSIQLGCEFLELLLCSSLYPSPASTVLFLSFLFLFPPCLPASSKKTLSPPPVCHDVTSSNIFFFQEVAKISSSAIIK